jgi:transcription elongation GreA/GreB family factor
MAIPLRNLRYFAERVRTANVVAAPASTEAVGFGSTVTFKRGDGRVSTFRIVGEDEADPKTGSISYVSPVARLLTGKTEGDIVGSGDQEFEIIAIA